MFWLHKRHWLVALWPLDDHGHLHGEIPWRTGIMHSDTEEGAIKEALTQLGVPASGEFRLWMIEITPDNAREGSVKMNIKWNSGKVEE